MTESTTPPSLTPLQEANMLKDCVLACIIGKNKISQTSNLWKRARGINPTDPLDRAKNIKNALQDIINMDDAKLSSYGVVQGTLSGLNTGMKQSVNYMNRASNYMLGKNGGTHRRRYKKKNRRTHRR